MRHRILALSLNYNGEWDRIAEGLKRGEDPGYTELSDPYITIADPQYPDILRTLRYPPWILFYKGDLTLLQQPCTAIVGSRNACRYALEMTEQCCRTLPRDIIVSGLARGVDGQAHRSALRYCKGTIGIAGCGLDKAYPAENRELYRVLPKKNLILSEYPPHTAPLAHHFPWRNRLIAGISRRLLVMQAGYHSGTMITVNEALQMGKEVWCLPYPAMDPQGQGCNLLISQGAMILDDPGVLLNEK